MKRNIVTALLLIVIIICALFGAWHLSGTDDTDTPVSAQKQDTVITADAPTETEKQTAPQEKLPESAEETGEIQSKAEVIDVPKDATPVPNEISASGEPICTISVRCDDVLNHMDKLSEEKQSIIPPNGIILQEETFIFSEGESVFDVLLRVMKEKNIHMEYVDTPMYNSVYIEGIGNLYEFDCGDTSGWQYRVNGIKPTYGCSQYKVKSGDRIEFFYQCSMFE